MLREERPYESLSQRMTRDSWVIIFADLLALLLTFFVLIFSMLWGSAKGSRRRS